MIFEIQASYGNVKIVPLYHPSMACYHPNMLENLKNDFQNSVGKLFKGKIL